MMKFSRIIIIALCVIILAACVIAVCITEKADVSEPVICSEQVKWQDGNGEFTYISFSHDSGTYEERILRVTVSTSPEYSIAYTTDGSVPSRKNDSRHSKVSITVKSGETGYLTKNRDLMLLHDFNQKGFYKDVSLPSGTVLRVVLFDRKGRMSEAVTKVFFPAVDFNESFPDCHVISIVTDPENLLDYYSGILATGAVYDEWKRSEEAKEIIRSKVFWFAETNSTQHGRAWERPAFFQLYDGSSTPVLECSTGLRVRGGISRRTVQKSFNLYFRDSHGTGALEYELFGGSGRYESLALKGGGNTVLSIKYKDPFLQKLVKDRYFTVLDSRPAVLFLNGEYWGPYNLQEKISAHMLSSRYAADEEQVVIIKDGEVEEGIETDIELYENLMSYEDRDLSDPEIFKEFSDVMDIRSMADYFAVQVYIGNADWKKNFNDVMWRTRDSSFNGGRWQYILFDTEYSCGLYGNEESSELTDHFQIAIEQYPLFAAAVKNKEFYDIFLIAVKEIGADCFEPERIQQEIQRNKAVWDPIMPDFYKRYGDRSEQEKIETERMIRFFDNRYDIIIPVIEKWGEEAFNSV